MPVGTVAAKKNRYRNALHDKNRPGTPLPVRPARLKEYVYLLRVKAGLQPLRSASAEQERAHRG